MPQARRIYTRLDTPEALTWRTMSAEQRKRELMRRDALGLSVRSDQRPGEVVTIIPPVPPEQHAATPAPRRRWVPRAGRSSATAWLG